MKMVKEDQYACVAHLGFVLHEHSQEKEASGAKKGEDIASDVSARFMLREIESFLRGQKLITGVAEQRAEAKRFLELMQIEAGLIVECGTDEDNEALYGFVHRTFQEYFAAADVYERYLQRENPRIISQFLKEHLHDPHWYEVTLLLLGKLKRVPVTAQLRQILEGKIKSSRSRYTEIVQQDLFFVCDCLAEEIAVENALAELVVSRLSHVVKTAPFPSQRNDALDYLSKLMQTRRYASLGQKELMALVTKDNILDTYTRLYAVQVLYLKSPKDSNERHVATQMLLQLTQSLDIPFEQAIPITQVLYQSSLGSSDERRFAIQTLHQLAQRSDLSFEQNVQVAQALYEFSTSGSDERHFAIQTLHQLAQRSDLSFEQNVQVAQALYWSSSQGSDEEQYSIQMLLRLAKNEDFIIDQRQQAIKEFISREFTNPTERSQALQVLFDMLEGEIASQYLGKYWEPIIKPEVSEIISIVERAQNDKQPSSTRDEMYRALRQMVPEFDKMTP